MPPNNGSNLIGMLIDTAQASASELSGSMHKLRFLPRNSEADANRAIAARVLLDRNATKIPKSAAEEATVESGAITEGPRGC